MGKSSGVAVDHDIFATLQIFNIKHRRVNWKTEAAVP